MSHFVSTGSNFDELNAQLLQRNTTEADEDDVDSQPSQRQNHQRSPNLRAANTSAAIPQPDKAYEVQGTIKGRTRPNSVASHLSDLAVGNSKGAAAGPSSVPYSSATASPYSISRKNSEDDIQAAARRAAHARRMDDVAYERASSPSNSPSRAQSPASIQGDKMRSQTGQRTSANKGVAFAEDVTKIDPSTAHDSPMRDATDEARPLLHDVSSQPHHGHHHHYHHHHRHHTSPGHHHVLGEGAYAYLRESGALPRTAPRKLGTWDGVFMPVSLNILGIILFLRFGFILGQVGLLGALLLLTVSYAVDTFTSMSVSAISTNGQVRGGGAYYLISRSLGPEFGGSIGLVFFLGQALNASMNVLGFVESLTDAFGQSREGFLPESPWWNFGYGSICLFLATIVCLVGSALFTRATLALAVVLGAAIISIPISSLVVEPFVDTERGAYYTGWSLATMRDNLFPHFTSGAAGSSTGSRVENWQTVFGVLFPAVTGLLAGVSMSGDLRKPSKSIPKGTNWSLLFTFGVYVLSFVVFAGTIARQSFYLDVGIVSDVAVSPQLITFGVLASTGFSALMGVMACGKVLQAIARDNLLPILDVFAQGTEIADTPINAVIATWIFCQGVLFVDSVNLIAQLVTMTSLLTFGTLSFATLALKAGGAPSFRPSFRYWNIWTAGIGTAASFGAMFFTEPLAASGCIVFAVFLFSAIHIFCPPKPWGDVTRNLNYHIVRKYLLRLDERKGRVTHWRPQILLLANNPRTEWNLIIFCNSLKKGALYVLGHVLKGEFTECLAELRKQQIAWLKLVDVSGIKSFVDVIIAQDEREGARNLILSCGLGGMRPNIVCLGFPNNLPKAPLPTARIAKERREGSEITIRGEATGGSHVHTQSGTAHQALTVEALPTDASRRETPILPSTFVGIMEDTLALQKALAVAYGFENMSLPGPSSRRPRRSGKEEVEELYIDLWPIQIQSPDTDQTHAWDTYTMVLQLGTILSMTGTWKYHKLRVSVFVEFEEDVEGERRRVRSLLDNLRVPASLRVFSLSSEQVSSYASIVRGREPIPRSIESVLAGDPWWETLKTLRKEEERQAREVAKAANIQAKKKSSAAAQPMPSALYTSDSHAPRRQTKREQRMLGVTLPPEHLEYFQSNMRIGLAHPRAGRRARRSASSSRVPSGRNSNGPGREGSDYSESESEMSASDSDEESGLSDELARLDLDDLAWMSSSAGNELRRSQTLQTAGSQRNGRHRAKQRRGSAWSGLPEEGNPKRGQLDSTNKDTSFFRTSTYGGDSRELPRSYGSMSSTPRPGFWQSQPLQTPRLAEEGLSEERSIGSDDPDGTLRASDRAKWQAQAQREGPISKAGVPSSISHYRAAEVTEAEECVPRLERKDRSHSRPQSRTYSSDRSHAKANQTENELSRNQTGQKSSSSGLSSVTFNHLPNKAQYLILNELIRTNSSSSTSVVLTSLPAPESGTSQDASRSLVYLEHLENLFGGGPPVLGVHAKQLTMTSAL